MPQKTLLDVLAAAVAAADWHAQQRRKGAAGQPYINHPLEVASLVSRATEGGDANLAIAALLHDAIEDQGVDRTTIAEQFGEDVADLVQEVSDDKSLPQDVRKRLQVEQARGKSARAKILKLLEDHFLSVVDVAVVQRMPDGSFQVERELNPSLAGVAVVTAATCVFAAIFAPVTFSSAKVLVEPAINMQAVTIPNVRPMLVSLFKVHGRMFAQGVYANG